MTRLNENTQNRLTCNSNRPLVAQVGANFKGTNRRKESAQLIEHWPYFFAKPYLDSFTTPIDNPVRAFSVIYECRGSNSGELQARFTRWVEGSTPAVLFSLWQQCFQGISCSALVVTLNQSQCRSGSSQRVAHGQLPEVGLARAGSRLRGRASEESSAE